MTRRRRLALWCGLVGALLALAACQARPPMLAPTTALIAPRPDEVHVLGVGQALDVVAEYPRPVRGGKVFFYVAWEGPQGSGQAPLRAWDAGSAQRGVGRWPPPGEPLPPGEYRLWAVAYRGDETFPSARARVVLLPPPASPTPQPPPPTAAAATPTPTPPLPASPPAWNESPAADACYRAAFVADVTVPDGSPVPVGEPFVKVWRLRNAGVCVWGPGTRVVRVVDQGLHAPESWLLPQAPIFPGETVDVEVTLQAQAEGPLQAAFQLQAVDGTRFGIGPGDGPFWVQVEAIAPTATPTPGPTP